MNPQLIAAYIAALEKIVNRKRIVKTIAFMVLLSLILILLYRSV